MNIERYVSGLELEPAARKFAEAYGYRYMPNCTSGFKRPVTAEVLRAMVELWLHLMEGGWKYQGPVCWDDETTGLTRLKSPGAATADIEYFRKTLRLGVEVLPGGAHMHYGLCSQWGDYNGDDCNTPVQRDSRDNHYLMAGMMRQLVTYTHCAGLVQPIYQWPGTRHTKAWETPWNQARAALAASNMAKVPGKVLLMANHCYRGEAQYGVMPPEDLYESIKLALSAPAPFVPPPTDQSIAAPFRGAAGVIYWDASAQTGEPSAAKREAEQLAGLQATEAAIIFAEESRG